MGYGMTKQHDFSHDFAVTPPTGSKSKTADFEQSFPTQFLAVASQWTSLTGKSNESQSLSRLMATFEDLGTSVG